MYSFLSGLVGGIRERFSGYPVVIKGSWEKTCRDIAERKSGSG
jgi:hypothetical protein